MALTLNAEQKSIYDIFSGKTHYFIPPYQRAYSWKIQHCRELFEDLKREFYNEKKEGYFLGNIVLAWSAEERNRFEVIDGQQRLTTLLLLLKVILAFDSENSDIKNAIWLIDSRTKEIIGERLQFSDYVENGSLYQKVLELDLSRELCEESIDEKNLFMQNICYFYKEIKALSQYEKIERFVDFLLYDVSLLPIETGDSTSGKAREKALKIFETINNRGLNLSNADIFKARLYEEAINELEEDKFIGLWNKFEHIINETKYSIDDIFYIYMHIIRGREGIRSKEFPIRDFFMEEDCSPFGHIKYEAIIYEVLKIAYSIKVFEDVKINPSKYGELTKWFQIIDKCDYRSDLPVPPSLLLSIIQLFVMNLLSIIKLENMEEIIIYFKNIVKYLLVVASVRNISIVIINIIYKKELINQEILTNKKYQNSSFHYNGKMKILLSNYLNENQKAIYPYYFKDFFTEKIKFKVVLDFDVKEDIDLDEKIKFLEESKIKDNIKLAKKLKKIPNIKFVDEVGLMGILITEEAFINKRIERFLKDEN